MKQQTKQSLQIALAELRGWTILVKEGRTYCWNDELNKKLPAGDDGMRPIPPLDHNELAKARGELLKTDELKELFYMTLYDSLPREKRPDSKVWRTIDSVVSSTPTQQAQALCKVFGKKVKV